MRIYNTSKNYEFELILRGKEQGRIPPSYDLILGFYRNPLRTYLGFYT